MTIVIEFNFNIGASLMMFSLICIP